MLRLPPEGLRDAHRARDQRRWIARPAGTFAHRNVPTGGRTLNCVWYIGNRFPVGNGLLFGLDYENWTTQYSAFRQGKASRIKVFASLAF